MTTYLIASTITGFMVASVLGGLANFSEYPSEKEDYAKLSVAFCFLPILIPLLIIPAIYFIWKSIQITAADIEYHLNKFRTSKKSEDKT